jgi:HK97 family phage prohead protease/HK97 family phage major capsid protein
VKKIELKRKNFQFKAAKVEDSDGVFEGYAAVFGNVDYDNDVIEPGAFAKFLQNGWDDVKILSQHNDECLPIGKPLELKEDDSGLLMKAQIIDTSAGSDVLKLMRGGVLDGLSIGYTVSKSYPENGIRHLTDLELQEISVVTWPANDAARVLNVKSKGKPEKAYMLSEIKSWQSKKSKKEKRGSKLMARNARNRKRGRKESGVTPEQIGEAVAAAVAAELEPIKKKLEELSNDEAVKEVEIDEAILEETGAKTPEELEQIINDAANTAAETLEADGNPVAAAVVDAGLDPEEILEEIVKRRKARKDAGEEVPAVTEEEVAEVIEEAAAEIAENLSAEEVEQLAGDEFLDEKEAEEEANKRHKKAKQNGKPGAGAHKPGKKSYSGFKLENKGANTPSGVRKYGLFLGGLTGGGASETRKPELTKEQRIVNLARAVKCMDVIPFLKNLPRDPEGAAYAAEKFYKDRNFARELKDSMSVTNPSAGGFFVPQDMVRNIIDMLYDATVIFELGAQRVEMPHGNLIMPKITSGASAYWDGEERPIRASRPGVGQLRLSAKRLSAMVPSTEELLLSTAFSSDLMFGNMLIRRMSLVLEKGAILGRGTDYEPLGLLNNKNVEKISLLTVNDSQIADASGRPSADLPIWLCGKVFRKNVLGGSFGWTFNTDMETYLKCMKSQTGQFIWKDEMDKGTLNGYPYRTTNIIPTENGMTSMIFRLWEDLIVGELNGLTTRTSYDATVRMDDGQDVSLFQTAQTATRAIMYVDVGLAHDEAFAVAANVKIMG